MVEEHSSSLIPNGTASLVVKSTNGVIVSLFPSFAGYLHRSIGTARAQGKIAEQQAMEQAVANGEIAALPDSSITELREALQSDFYISAQKHRNRTNVFARFEELWDEEIPLSPIREEISNKVYEYLGDCSTETAKELWARLLVGESKKPGTVSKNTLRVLNELSAENANIFQNYFPVIVNGLLYRPTEIPETNIKLLFQEHILQDYNKTIVIDILPKQNFVFICDNLKFYIKNNGHEKITLKGYILTKIGSEIVKACSSKFEIQSFIENISDKSTKFEYGEAPAEMQSDCEPYTQTIMGEHSIMVYA